MDLSEFSYVYKACSLKPGAITYWLSIPEFQEELRRLRRGKKRINDARFLRSMRMVYKHYLELKRSKVKTEGFIYSQSKKDIKWLAEIVEGERSLYGKTE